MNRARPIYDGKLIKSLILGAAIAALVATASAQVSEETLQSITTPDKVETSIGTLNFVDGAPLPETVQKVYGHLDTMRGVDAYLKGMPGASLYALIEGAHSQGTVECHQVIIFDKLMDSRSLFLTGNTSTLYVLPDLDLERDGPTVLEAPAGMLGAFNDAWFHYVEDIGPFGPDKGKPFAPDARMNKILTDAVAIGNATARSIVWYSRTDGTMKGSEIYPGKSFFVALRMYGPLEPWIDKTWRPGEVEPVERVIGR